MVKIQRWLRKPQDLEWEDQLRIVGVMYELIGKQNGATVEQCLEEIARHVSEKEKRRYSVTEIEAVYERTTFAKLRSEVRSAQRTPLDLIRRRTEAIRKQYLFDQGFHNDPNESLSEKEKEGLYELFKRKRVGF